MRLFIAIDFPGQEQYFKELQDQISDEHAKIKKVNAFHLTLKFLGEVFEEDLPKIKEALKNIKFKPFKKKLTDIGYFPSESFIKVVWVGFKPKEQLIQLQQQIENALDEFNIRKDFEFVPHLTLARVSFMNDLAKFKQHIHKIQTKHTDVDVTEFKLIKSTLTTEGPTYEDLKIFTPQKQ